MLLWQLICKKDGRKKPRDSRITRQKRKKPGLIGGALA